MKILIINPPHPSIGSRIPREHLPPLGLLSLGGPLIDAGHATRLLDAEFGPMSVEEILAEVRRSKPDAVLLGHSGSTSAHPMATRIAQAVRAALPQTWTYEIWQWLFYDRRTRRGPKLVEFLKRPWGANAIAPVKSPQPWHAAPNPLFLSRVDKGKLAPVKADAVSQP